MSEVNIVVVSGTVNKIFDRRKTKSGDATQSFSLEHQATIDKTQRYIVSAFGKYPMADMDDLREGQSVVVQGRLHSYSFKDDEDKWVNRTEISANRIHTVAPDRPVADDDGGWSGAPAAHDEDDGIPF